MAELPRPARRISMKRTLFPSLLLMIVLPLVARGGSLADRWVTGLKEVDQKLRAQQWEEARKQAREVAGEIVDDAGRNKDAGYTLAVTSVFRAIAEAGLGRQDDADWYWDLALNLVPGIGKTNLSPYGDAVAGLKGRTLRGSRPPVEPGELWTEDGRKVPRGKVEPPRILRQVRPEYPEKLNHAGVPGRVIVETILGADGRPRSPRVLEMQGGGHAMKYAALDALGQWRFEPAKLEGQPVAVFYTLTINFKIGR